MHSFGMLLYSPQKHSIHCSRGEGGGYYMLARFDKAFLIDPHLLLA